MQAGKTVLLCEDDAVNRMLIGVILGKADHRVVEVENGAACLEYLQSGYDGIDLLLLDISLPDISGVEVCQAIRSGERGGERRLPVVAYTGYASAEERNDFLKSGFDDVLVKPITMKKLLALLDEDLLQ